MKLRLLYWLERHYVWVRLHRPWWAIAPERMRRAIHRAFLLECYREDLRRANRLRIAR